jgi:poly-gamma-glutamate capsule biosynthesis protein CapA/YwtB (metallophosphatase superfamily)
MLSLAAVAACNDSGSSPAGPTAVTTSAPRPAAPTGSGTRSPTSPASAPSTCPGTACVTITMTGDVLLHQPLWAQAASDARARGASGYDFGPMLAGQRALVSSSDLAICHLETPLASPTGPFRGYPSFSVPPQIAKALRDTGYDACTTASNHTLDAGAAGVDRTLAVLDAAGLRHTGSARSAREAARPLVFDVRGTQVALLAYTYGLNGIAVPAGQPWRVNVIDVKRILRDARAARLAGADVVVVALHWGLEYQRSPTAEQRAVADELLADPDIDLVYGHHAHVVQPVQRLHGKWVVYGLGNAIAAQTSHRPETYAGLLVRVQLVRGTDGRWHSGPLDLVPSVIKTSPYRWAAAPTS